HDRLAPAGCPVHARWRGHRLDRDALALRDGAPRRGAAVARQALRLDRIRVHVTPIDEAAAEDTPHGRYVTSDGWFVLNLDEALAVKNDERGGATYPLESREAKFRDFGANVQVIWPGEPNCYYHSENAQEGFLILRREGILGVEEPERQVRGGG